MMALGERFDCIQLVDIEEIIHTHPGDCFVDDTITGSTNDYVSSLPVEACEQGLVEEEKKLLA
jgi:hypothetical protein